MRMENKNSTIDFVEHAYTSMQQTESLDEARLEFCEKFIEEISNLKADELEKHLKTANFDCLEGKTTIVLEF